MAIFFYGIKELISKSSILDFLLRDDVLKKNKLGQSSSNKAPSKPKKKMIH